MDANTDPGTPPDLSGMRLNYEVAELLEESVEHDPLRQFQRWFDEARAADGIAEPNAMTLATAGAAGEVSARIVLLKGLDERGFQFFTNYESRKGRQLAETEKAALVFFWEPLQRQVTVRGWVERLPAEESDAYFRARPYGSRIGAWASAQSEEIPGRAWLEERAEAFKERYPEGSEVPRPANWGGYHLIPLEIEFWQGRPSRLHDRLRFVRAGEGDSWKMRRLSP